MIQNSLATQIRGGEEKVRPGRERSCYLRADHERFHNPSLSARAGQTTLASIYNPLALSSTIGVTGLRCRLLEPMVGLDKVRQHANPVSFSSFHSPRKFNTYLKCLEIPDTLFFGGGGDNAQISMFITPSPTANHLAKLTSCWGIWWILILLEMEGDNKFNAIYAQICTYSRHVVSNMLGRWWKYTKQWPRKQLALLFPPIIHCRKQRKINPL